MPKSAVLDASVLVSAFLFPDSVPGRVYEFGRDGLYIIHLSEVLLEETRRSLNSPRLLKSYPRDAAEIDSWLADLRQAASVITKALPDIPATCRDPNDDHVIAAAIAAQARVIVTGDADLLDLEQHGDIRILTPRTFLDQLHPADEQA